ncbi:IS3 family transposase [Kordia sp. TARA_039_SRF]|nr:IS3 family transposase [Kordia sp. TARA_039_SRF]
MKQRYANIGLTKLCGVLGKSRQTYYERIAIQETKEMKEDFIISLVKQKRKEMPELGGSKLYRLLKKELPSHGLYIGRDRLFKLLRLHDLLIKPKKNYTKTTNSFHRFRKYPNLIKDIKVNTTNQIWVADITYVSVKNQFAYLSLITDAYSRKIVGYYLHKTLETKGCLMALVMAIDSLAEQPKSLIHHSDRGIQYCSNQYIATLDEFNIDVSMTNNGDPYENAIAERINGILKTEFGISKKYSSYKEAVIGIEKSIFIYNHKRPHMSCDFLTPAEAHKMKGQLKKHW